jgi:hypothetical protein
MACEGAACQQFVIIDMLDCTIEVCWARAARAISISAGVNPAVGFVSPAMIEYSIQGDAPR